MIEIAGRTFCITGKLENFATRADAYEEITLRGGNASKTLTPGCDFLVLGAKGNENYAFGTKGTKQVRAEQWIRQGRGIRIITENQLIALVEASAEVTECERGEVLSRSFAPRQSAISRDRVGGLECSWCFHGPRPEAPQVLRITYESAPSSLDMAQMVRNLDMAQMVRNAFQGLKGKAKQLGWRNSVRTELVPVSWAVLSEKDGEMLLQEEELLVCARIVCVLDSESAKTEAREVVQEIKREVIRWDLGGQLSLRIWDAEYRYGRFWLKKLGR